jgi:Ca2+/Na+ antiporter
LGNVVGSSISNILGAFALGLIFHPGKMTFDRSAKMYTAILLGITTLFSVFLMAFGAVKGLAGPFLMLLFVIYVSSIAYAIYKGTMEAPVDSDSDSSSSSDSNSSDSDSDSGEEYGSGESDIASEATLNESSENVIFSSKSHDQNIPSIKVFLENGDEPKQPPRRLGLKNKARRKPMKKMQIRPAVVNKRPKTLAYHIRRLLLGVVALSVACYVLSHSIASVGDDLGFSGTLVGITILSLATTLPEKFVAILSGSRGQGGIVVANTVGSNIFLLTLCAGVLFMFGDASVLETGIHFSEVAVMWASSVALAFCVFMGADRKIGFVMLGMYAAFIVAEFTIFRAGEGPDQLADLADDLFKRVV